MLHWKMVIGHACSLKPWEYPMTQQEIELGSIGLCCSKYFFIVNRVDTWILKFHTSTFLTLPTVFSLTTVGNIWIDRFSAYLVGASNIGHVFGRNKGRWQRATSTHLHAQSGIYLWVYVSGFVVNQRGNDPVSEWLFHPVLKPKLAFVVWPGSNGQRIPMWMVSALT